MATVSHQLTPQLSCHAWSADQLHVAICPNNHEIYVYRKGPGGRFDRIHTLSDHDQLVSGLDWSRNSNQLVSCSHDRNSYVFTWQDQTLQPQMVITRLSKAATCVRWSPCERKFAIGSAAKAICICYYEQESNWWASKLIRKQHDSSILQVSWHPDSILLATASSDGKSRVFSTALPGTDPNSSLAGTSAKFGDCVLQVDSMSGWCHAVAWSPSGSQLCFTSHGSTIHFILGLGGTALLNSSPVRRDQVAAADRSLQHQLPYQLQQQCIQHRQLPFKVAAFVQEDMLVAGGFDGEMYLFIRKQQQWQLSTALEGNPKLSHAHMKKELSSDFNKKLDMFKQQSASPANSKVSQRSTQPRDAGHHKPAHTNCITDLQNFKDQHRKCVCAFSTAGLDGRIVLWDVPHHSA